MDSHTSHEIVGGPFDGHFVHQQPDMEMPAELLMPFGPAEEFQRMGKYELQVNGDYLWMGEYIVRDVTLAATD